MKEPDPIRVPEFQHHMRDLFECVVCGRWRTNEQRQDETSRVCQFCVDVSNHRNEIETFNPLDHEQSR